MVDGLLGFPIFKGKGNIKYPDAYAQNYERSHISTTIGTMLGGIFRRGGSNFRPQPEFQTVTPNGKISIGTTPIEIVKPAPLLMANPKGSKGSQEHQDKIKEVEKDMESRGLETEREVKVETPDGEKNYRRIDVVGKDPVTGEIIEPVQVGVENKNGTPVSREVKKAINDIERVIIMI